MQSWTSRHEPSWRVKKVVIPSVCCFDPPPIVKPNAAPMRTIVLLLSLKEYFLRCRRAICLIHGTIFSQNSLQKATSFWDSLLSAEYKRKVYTVKIDWMSTDGPSESWWGTCAWQLPRVTSVCSFWLRVLPESLSFSVRLKMQDRISLYGSFAFERKSTFQYFARPNQILEQCTVEKIISGLISERFNVDDKTRMF